MKISRFRGDDYANKIAVVDSNGAAITLTTETFTMTVNSEEYPPDNSTEIFTVAGTITDAANGKVSFADDGSTAVGIYFYDIQMVDTLSKKRTIAKDYYVVTQDVTKA